MVYNILFVMGNKEAVMIKDYLKIFCLSDWLKCVVFGILEG